jgi:purine-binding chemotaxis protein CheW
MNHPEQEIPVRTVIAPGGDVTAIDSAFLSDKSAAAPKGERFVAFFLNDKLYAIPSFRIAEVIHPLSITPLPGAREWLLGVANLRGEILAVLNLKTLWNADSPALSEKAKLIVLQSEHSETRFAFKVDRLSEIVTIFGSETERVKEKANPQIYAKVVRGSSTFHLIDTGDLLASLAFN